MKKVTFVRVCATICFCFLFLVGPDIALGQLQPKPKDIPAVKIPQQMTPSVETKPKIPEGIQRLGRAQLSDLEIGTDGAGRWFWKVTVTNTGTTVIDGKKLTAQGYSISFPSAQNSWKPASGTSVSQTNIAPNQSVTARAYWTRCCLTDQLEVKLFESPSNAIWDAKKITNLLFNPAQKKPLDVRMKSIEWDDTQKAWRATVKNFTNYTVKIAVQGYLWPVGTNQSVPAGGTEITLGPHEEKAAMALHATTAKNGDLLKAHIWFPMGCGESFENCGGAGSYNITIPNSTTFF